MDCRTGEIKSLEEVEKLPEEEKKFFKPMEIAPTVQQLKSNKVGRNHPCPCGSNRKFKRCCWTGR